MSTLDELATRLQSAGVGVVGATLFKGRRPPAPDACVTINEYYSNAPEFILASSVPNAERPQVQVMARGTDYEATMAKAKAAWSSLAAVANMTLSGTFYRHILVNGSPAHIGNDENDRFLIGFNVTVEKDVS